MSIDAHLTRALGCAQHIFTASARKIAPIDREVAMPFDGYARITPDDLDALVAYLRSLQSVK